MYVDNKHNVTQQYNHQNMNKQKYINVFNVIHNINIFLIIFVLIHVIINKITIHLLNMNNMSVQIIVEVIKMIKNIYGTNKMVKNNVQIIYHAIKLIKKNQKNITMMNKLMNVYQTNVIINNLLQQNKMKNNVQQNVQKIFGNYKIKNKYALICVFMH